MQRQHEAIHGAFTESIRQGMRLERAIRSIKYRLGIVEGVICVVPCPVVVEVIKRADDICLS